MIYPDDLAQRLTDLADRAPDTPPHRRTHVAVLIDRLERLIPAAQPDPDDTPEEP